MGDDDWCANGDEVDGRVYHGVAFGLSFAGGVVGNISEALDIVGRAGVAVAVVERSVRRRVTA